MNIFYIKNKWWQERIAILKKILYVFAIILSIGDIATLIFRFGYDIDSDLVQAFDKMYFISFWAFFLESILQLLDNYRKLNKRVKWFSIFFLMLYVSVFISSVFKDVLVVYKYIEFFNSSIFVTSLLMLSSMIYVAKFVVGALAKKTNPSLILSISFLVIIFLGTLFLMLPRSVNEPIEFLDALFVATSAVCVTGLTPIDLYSVFTMDGQLVIMALIQIGGLGVMTITSFFGLFFMGQTSLYNKFVVKDILNTDSIGSLLRMMVYVFLFTLMFELVGAFLLWLSIRGTLGMTLFDELYFSVFHAVSSFCNAGFSTMPNGLENSMLIKNNNIYYIISLLIICGGLGFPILTNITSTLIAHTKELFLKVFKKRRVISVYHIISVNSKIVLLVTIILVIGGALLIALLEWNNSFAEFTVSQKIAQSFFNAVTPRTAGFNSVDMTGFTHSTILLLLVLMWIGGGAQSTAGGIKVNVFGVAMYTLINSIRSNNRVEIMGREISPDSINRVVTTIMLSFFTLFIAIMFLMYFEKDVAFERVLFEAVSALTTTGLSLNLTPSLHDSSKVVIIVLMFIGRVGLFTFVMGFVPKIKTDRYRYPIDNVIIN